MRIMTGTKNAINISKCKTLLQFVQRFKYCQFMESLSIFRTFISLAQLKSFTKVAEKERVNPSSISRKIETLEGELGLKLFQRNTRNVVLTPAGKVYLESITKLLEDFEEAQRTAIGIPRGPKGTLRVTAPVSFSRIFLAPLVVKFLKQYPEINISIDANNQNVNLGEGEFDLAIRIGNLPSSGLVSKKMIKMKRVVCASPEYLAQKGIPAKPKDLKDHLCLVAEKGPTTSVWNYSKGSKRYSVEVKGPLKSNYADLLAEAARAGLGIGLFPTWLVEDDLKAGRLIQILDSFQWDSKMSKDGQTDIQIIYPSKKTLSEPARLLIDFLSAS